MDSKLTDLAKLAALSAAALPGPWFCNCLLNGCWRVDDPSEDAPIATMHQGHDEQRRNGQLIAAMRNNIDALVAECLAAREWLKTDLLRAKLAEVEKELDSHRSSLGDKITECDALHEELSQMQWGTPVHKRRADEAEKRIAEVEKERDGYRATLCVINDQKPPMSDREAILREALEAIERRVVHCISEWGLEVREIARAALAAKL